MYIEMLKALADEKRLEIMCLLLEGSRCVCEIEPALNCSQSSTSKHLIKLKQVGLIESQKKGQWVHYYIPNEIFIKHPFLKLLILEVKQSKQVSEEKK